MRLAIRIASLLVALAAMSGPARGDEPLRLGVHPYLPATELVKRFTPMAKYLEEALGRPVEVVISRNYEEHIDRVGKGEVDIAYMGPASYVLLVERYGKRPILARQEVQGQDTFRGVIIVRKESPLRELSELRGKRFAFGDPDSTMSHLVPRHMLIEAGVDAEDLAGYKFLKGHHNVALGVLLGDFDAGAVKEEVFYEYEERGLRALRWTPEISDRLFVASPKLPRETVKALREAMFRLKDSPRGRAVMAAIKEEITDLVPGRDEDYENLRRIMRGLEARGIRP